jgi:DNA-directed RNA polymerase specialized sigma24 family protein
MDPRPLEELFTRWRDAHELAALAEVFDRSAPELLQIARHLVRREAEAEDLVQATFLAALEGAERFDAARALVPWLVGILTHTARRSRRAEPGAAYVVH